MTQSVLVDTSVWVDHFRRGNPELVRPIVSDQALTHPLIVAELRCGTPPAPRVRTLNDMDLLTPCRQASLREVMDFVERERLFGLGCGVVDLSLLASTLITPSAQLWTLDRRLADLARRFGVGYLVGAH